MSISFQTVSIKHRLDQALERLQDEDVQRAKAFKEWRWLVIQPNDYNWTSPEHRERFAAAKLKTAAEKSYRIGALREEFDDVWVNEYNTELCQLWQNEGVNINS